MAAPLLFAARLPQGLLLLVVAALVLVFSARGLLTRSFLPATAANWPNLLLLLVLPVGLWASTDVTASGPVIYKAVAGFAIFYGLAGLADARWMRALPWLLVVVSAGLALVVLLGANWATAKVSFLPDTIYSLLPTVRLPWRPEGIHPNLAGSAMAWLLLPAAAMALWSRNRRLQGLAAVAAALLAVTLLLSQSRGAWLGAAVGLSVMPALRYRRWWILLAAALAVALVVTLVVGPAQMAAALFPASAAEEVTVNTLPGRLELWTRALAMLHDFGPSGAGPGQFEQVVMVLYPPFFTGLLGGFQHAHNQFLQMAVDFGVPGLVAFVALLIALGAGMVAATWRWPAEDQPDAPLAALTAGIFGSLLALTIHGLVDAPIVAPRGLCLAFRALWHGGRGQPAPADPRGGSCAAARSLPAARSGRAPFRWPLSRGSAAPRRCSWR
ncbi:MAG: O-antigen ligase family protein [Anaerolineae bacterium]